MPQAPHEEAGRPPAWCVEGAPGGARVLVAICVSWLSSIWPWSFFGELEHGSTLRWIRLLGYLVALVAVPVLICAVAQTTLAMRVHSALRGDETTSTDVGLSAAVAQAVLRPFSARPLGELVHADDTTSYPTPMELHAVARLQAGHFAPFDNYWGDHVKPMLFAAGFAAAFYVTLPAVFFAFARMRRQAMSVADVVRVTIYGGSMPCFVAVVIAVCYLLVCIREAAGNRAFDIAELILVVVPVPFAALWWMAVATRYLRWRRGWIAALAASLTTVALVGLGLRLLVPEELARAVDLLT